MKSWYEVDAKEGDIVWANRPMYKDEDVNQYALDLHAKQRPFVVLYIDGNDYYCLSVTSSIRKIYGNYVLYKEKYEKFKKSKTVNLNHIYKLTKQDMINVMLTNKGSCSLLKEDMDHIINRMANGIAAKRSVLLPDEQALFIEQHNKKVQLSVGKIIRYLDEPEKLYLIIETKNKDEYIGFECSKEQKEGYIKVEGMPVEYIDFSSKKTILNNRLFELDEIKFRYSEILKLENSFKEYQRNKNRSLDSKNNKQKTKDKPCYICGTIIERKEHKYIVLMEDDDILTTVDYNITLNYFVIETINKKDDIKIIGNLDNKEIKDILKLCVEKITYNPEDFKNAGKGLQKKMISLLFK